VTLLVGILTALFLGIGQVHGKELPQSDWHYGGFLNLSYAVDFNFPDNHLWWSKSTTRRINEPAPNNGGGYIRKDVSERSRWGMELAAQGGYETDELVPEPNSGRDKPVDGADTLRHISRANMSYLAPVGNGLVLTQDSSTAIAISATNPSTRRTTSTSLAPI